ncbi:MAG: universal stress protein [Acidimicrobiales bacterium]|nr:MAG: universal stress protein [Acidimicrobiales bacterium]
MARDRRPEEGHNDMLKTDEAVVDHPVANDPDPGRWIVGIDGSECATNAVRWVVANAPGRATSLEFLTAWQAPTIGAYPMSSPSVTVFDDSELIAAAADETEVVAERCRAALDVPVESFVGRGGPAEVLLAASEHAGLLVVGSRGRGGFARLLLGSTSTQCATHATVPTVVVPGDLEPIASRRILVGFDGSPNSLAAVRWAVQFASADSTVVVAWVWDATPLAVGSDAFFFPDASDLAAERFNHLVEPIEYEASARDVTIEREFIRGTPRAALASHADDVDLVVVGARGHGAVGSALLGSVSTWILHHVHRPIVVVPFSDPAPAAADASPPPDNFRG